MEIPPWLFFCSKGTEAIAGSEAMWKVHFSWSYKFFKCQSQRSFPPSCPSLVYGLF